MTYPMQPLSALGIIQTGSTPLTAEEKYWGGDYPFVTPAELDQNLPLTDTPRTLSEEGANQSRLLQEGAVMVCCIGSLGKIGIAGRPVVTNQQINSIEFDGTKVLPRYGFYACQRLKPKLLSMAPATTIPIVSKSKFGQLEIPIPPLPEQRRIAAILDQVDALRAKRREALAQLDSFTQSIFIQMFGDPIKNPKGWQIQPLVTVSDRIQIGPFGSQLHEEDYIDDGVPLVNPTHIKKGKIYPDWSLTVPDKKYKQLSQYHLSEDDLILGRRGEMGRCAVVTANEQGWLCGTGSLFVRPNTKVLNAMYLGHVVASKSMRRYLENVAKGVTMANLNKDIVGALPIPIPPIQYQLDFVSQLTATESLHVSNSKSSVELDELFTSLEHLAFRGEL